MKISEILNRNTPCLAPHHVLYFNKDGNVSVCCCTKKHIIGHWPTSTIKEIWFGEELKKMREDMKNKNFSESCRVSCIQPIKSGNFENTMLKTFDNYQMYFKNKNDYPLDITFELSNICNYECIMCGGNHSSSIRKNREDLKKIECVYNDNFIDQLVEFIPYLKIVKFYGGEPFLYNLNYKILDKIVELNPDCQISITTNGSILNDKIKTYFEKLKNLKVTISLDSINKKTYELIRKNGNFENVMSNLNFFLSHKVLIGISVCPMIQNIYELPNIINFCNNHNIEICFNRTNGPLGGYIKGIHQIPSNIKQTYEDSEIIDFCVKNKIKLHSNDDGKIIGGIINNKIMEIQDIPNHFTNKKEPPLSELIPVFTLKSLKNEEKTKIRKFLEDNFTTEKYSQNICKKINGLINEYLIS